MRDGKAREAAARKAAKRAALAAAQQTEAVESEQETPVETPGEPAALKAPSTKSPKSIVREVMDSQATVTESDEGKDAKEATAAKQAADEVDVNALLDRLRTDLKKLKTSAATVKAQLERKADGGRKAGKSHASSAAPAMKGKPRKKETAKAPLFQKPQRPAPVAKAATAKMAPKAQLAKSSAKPAAKKKR